MTTTCMVIGAGYVGLPTALCLASSGHTVHLVERDPRKRAMMEAGHSPIDEPGVEALLAEGLASGRIKICDRPADEAAYVFLCVGTPFSGYTADPDTTPALDALAADVGPLKAAALEVATALGPRGAIVIVRSTVPPGTGEMLEKLVNEQLIGANYPGRNDLHTVVSHPEFLREGSAIGDILHQTRVVLGGARWATDKVAREFYPDIACLKMSRESAELAKYASNTMLAARLMVMNELADICEGSHEARIGDIRAVLSTDPRIGEMYLAPGPGCGGSCLPKDLPALLHSSMRLTAQHFTTLDGDTLEVSYVPAVIARVASENTRRMREYLFHKVAHHLEMPLQAATIGVWGLAFKSGTDDIRESAAVYLIERLAKAGAHVKCHDPSKRARDAALVHFAGKSVEVCDDPEMAAAEVDALVLATDWPEYRDQELLATAADVMHGDLFIDGRGSYTTAQGKAVGLRAFIIGEPQRGDRRE